MEKTALILNENYCTWIDSSAVYLSICSAMTYAEQIHKNMLSK